MKIFNLSLRSVVCVLFLFIVCSCSGGKNPISASDSNTIPGRGVMMFLEARHLFGDINPWFPESSEVASESDAAAVKTLYHGDPSSSWGYEETWVSDTMAPWSWIVAAATIRTGDFTNPQSRISLLFLPDDFGSIVWVPTNDGGSKPHPQYYFDIPSLIEPAGGEVSNPRVAAIALNKYSPTLLTTVEVTVVHQWREVPNDPSSVWDLKVFRATFNLDAFSPFFLDGGYENDPGPGPFDDWPGNQTTPDIEYDYMNGDIHLVWAHSDNPWVSYCYWRQYDRSMDSWGGDALVSTLAFNGWTPRIDVGYVFPLANLDYDDRIVAVVYTAQQPHEDDEQHDWAWKGFRLYANFWLWNENPAEDNAFYIANPNYEPGAELNLENYILSSGMPMIDIAPYKPTGPDDHNEAMVVYMQEVSLSPWNSKAHEVWGITNVLYGPEGYGDYVWFPIAQADNYGDNTYYSAVLPSVCAHHIIPDETDPSMQGSVTYARTPAPFYSWEIDARRIYWDPDDPLNPRPEDVITNIPDSQAWGNFDFYDMALRCFGASSALTALWVDDDGDDVFDSQVYWAVWSDTLGVYCEPGYVDGAWGWTCLP